MPKCHKTTSSFKDTRLRVVESLLAIIVIPITVRPEEFSTLFVTPNISRTLDKKENQSLAIFWIIWKRILGALTRCHTSTSCTLLLIYLRFEHNMKCLWQHRATNNRLKITRNEWSEVFDPIVTTAHRLRQVQPGNWKVPIKPRTEELKNLLSALQVFTKFPHFKNTHPLTRHLVKELICHLSVSIFRL